MAAPLALLHCTFRAPFEFTRTTIGQGMISQTVIRFRRRIQLYGAKHVPVNVSAIDEIPLA
jgi:hypothetical protein